LERLMPELWTERAGARLFAVDEGRGPPVVMLHGGLADHRAVGPVVAPLAGRYRLILPDVRGSGRSHFAGVLDWRTLADDLAAVLDAAGIDRAVVGGTSGGAGVAARFALDHPDRLTAVVFNLPHYAGGDVGPTAYQREQLGGVWALAQQALTEGMGVMESAYAGLPDGVREAALAMVRSFDPASYATTAAFLASGEQPFASASALSAIKVPVLILPGDDPMHPAETSALYVRAMPQAQVGGDLAAFVSRVNT
jgi:pimeloyl-ACP methyl ester carboxylesterase